VLFVSILIYKITYFNYLWTYDLYIPVRNTFDAGKSITRGSGKGGWALEIKTFLGLWNGIEPLGEDHFWGPKKSRFPGPIPLPFAQVIGLPSSKALHTGSYLSKVVLCTWASTALPPPPHFQKSGGKLKLQNLLEINRKLRNAPEHKINNSRNSFKGHYIYNKWLMSTISGWQN